MQGFGNPLSKRLDKAGLGPYYRRIAASPHRRISAQSVRRARRRSRAAQMRTDMTILNEGEIAPNFTLKTDDGTEVTLASLTDKPLVLFFYPKDDTPGCTIECKEFRDARSAFEERAYVFGVSPDDSASHLAFRAKYSLNFPLLSDPEHRVADLFGVWGPKKSGAFGIHRTTFVIRGTHIARVFREVKPDGHAAEVLAAL
jgi:peroxiredoxin Q/BCP